MAKEKPVLRKLVRISPGRGKYTVLYVSIPAKLHAPYKDDDYVTVFPVDPEHGILLIAPASKSDLAKQYIRKK